MYNTVVLFMVPYHLLYGGAYPLPLLSDANTLHYVLSKKQGILYSFKILDDST